MSEYRVRKRDDKAPSQGERLVGYVVPMVLCALLGGAGAAFFHASGGGGRARGRVSRAASVTSQGVKTAAAIGAVLGALGGAVIARQSSRRGGGL